MDEQKITTMLNKLLEEQKKTNVLLQNLINIMSSSIDMAVGGEVFNKDFLLNEEHNNFITG
jgi:hypothetical protein